MNGDGQMDPDILDRIIEPIVCGDSDYAKGNRLRYAEYRREMSGWRTFGNYLLTYLTRVASGYWRMMDPQNGYTAISKNALERVDLETLYEDYGFCNHLLVRLNKRGLRIADIPMRAVYGDETSNIRYKTFIPSLSLLLLQSYIGRLVGGEARGHRQSHSFWVGVPCRRDRTRRRLGPPARSHQGVYGRRSRAGRPRAVPRRRRDRTPGQRRPGGQDRSG